MNAEPAATGHRNEDGPAGHADHGISAALQEYARAYRGATSILVRPMAPFEGLDRVVERVAARAGGELLVTDLHTPHGHLPRGSSVADPPGSQVDPLLAFHTSGSTGSPKCVVYRRATAGAHARAIAAALDLDAGTIYAALPPPRFAYGLSILNSHLEVGVPVTFADAEWGLGQLLALAATADGPLAVYALPQHTPLLLAADLDPRRLRRLFVAGGRLSGSSARALAERFPGLRLTNMYGQAEMGPRLAVWDGDPAGFAEGSIGSPLPGVRLRVEAPDGRIGPLHARNPYAMAACLRSPYAEFEAGPGDGEIVTGDLATRTAGGLVHEGRGDHTLNVAGTKVDLRVVGRLVEREFAPLLVRAGSRRARVGGDVVPVLEIVPGPDGPAGAGPIKRALHREFGSLAGLFDIRLVDRLEPKESGK